MMLEPGSFSAMLISPKPPRGPLAIHLMSYNIQSLRAGFIGELFEPKDASYNQARKIWNASVDKRPGLIARCSGIADAIAAINFGRENNLLTAILRYPPLLVPFSVLYTITVRSIRRWLFLPQRRNWGRIEPCYWPVGEQYPWIFLQVLFTAK